MTRMDFAAILLLTLGTTGLAHSTAHADTKPRPAWTLKPAWVDIDMNGALDAILLDQDDASHLTFRIFMDLNKVPPTASATPDFIGKGVFGNEWQTPSPSPKPNRFYLGTTGTVKQATYESITRLEIKDHELWVTSFSLFWDANSKLGACDVFYDSNYARVVKYGGISKKLPDTHLVPLTLREWAKNAPPDFCPHPP